MSRDPRSSPERPLAEDEEWDDDESEVSRPPLSRRAKALIAVGVVAFSIMAVPILILTVPAVSDSVLLPRASDALVLDARDLPAGFTAQLDQPKAMDLGLDDNQLGLVRKAQLFATGFGGGWVRNLESASVTGLVQVNVGVSVYRGVEGAHIEWERTIADLAQQGQWKRFALGTDIGDESFAYEQAIADGHAALVYYRYANLLAQVSLTYRGAPDDAFRGAAKALRDLARAQTEKERFSRFKP